MPLDVTVVYSARVIVCSSPAFVGFRPQRGDASAVLRFVLACQVL